MNVPERKRPWIKDKRQSSRLDGFYQSQYWRSVRSSFRQGFKIIDGKELSNKLCLQCYKQGTIREGRHTDHIIQKKLGGSDNEDNLQTLCDQCHNRKSAIEGNAMQTK